MKSVLYFTQPRWAFAQIHHGLVKRMWDYGIYSHLLDWTLTYTVDEMQMLADKFDLFLTTPEAVRILNMGNIPTNRMIAVAHCERDIAIAIHEGGKDFFNDLYAYAGVNQDLVEVSKRMGVTREMQVVRIGIDGQHYKAEPATHLNKVGYAGAMEAWLSHGPEIKRGRLFTRICDELGLEKVFHNNHHHLCMAGFYKKCDAVLVTSSSETVGLPILEAAASGRLVISAQVGYANGKQGILCRMDDEDYMTDAKSALLFYRNNPIAYREACHAYQDYVLRNHDWSQCIKDWVNLVNPHNSLTTLGRVPF